MVFARTTMREEIMVAVAEHKKVEFLYSLDGFDYFTIDGKWVRIPTDGKVIYGVEY